MSESGHERTILPLLQTSEVGGKADEIGVKAGMQILMSALGR